MFQSNKSWHYIGRILCTFLCFHARKQYIYATFHKYTEKNSIFPAEREAKIYGDIDNHRRQ